jgi:hypothetical protein
MLDWFSWSFALAGVGLPYLPVKRNAVLVTGFNLRAFPVNEFF